MGLAGATVTHRGTPIARMRAKVKLRQVVTPLPSCHGDPCPLEQRDTSELYIPVALLRWSFFPLLLAVA